jgi:ribosomal protein S18 acetylase RimI-like enzyme
MSEVRLCTGQELLADASLQADVRDLYAEAFREPPYRDEPEKAADWAAGPLLRHAGLAGFVLAVAVLDERPAGFAYGALGEEESWFVDWVRAHTPAEVHEEWLPGHGTLTELAVRSDARGRGLGGRLHDAVVTHLAASGAERLVLVAQELALPARGLYARRGWRDLAELAPGSWLMGVRPGRGEASHTRDGFGPNDPG